MLFSKRCSPAPLFALAALLTSVVPSHAQTTEQGNWSLHSGDRVVFYGDSITEQHFYTWWTELFAATRFPKEEVSFFNAGVGGDQVSGGGGGPIDRRLQRDVFSRNPTVITIMLGMNDGHYSPLTPAIEHDYRAGYEHILNSIEKNAPSARVLIVSPSPFDEITGQTQLFPGGYNATLLRLGEIDRELAAEHHTAFADANHLFTAALMNASKLDRRASQMLVPDRIHPDWAAHLLIAAAILKGWNAPSLVSRTELNAQTGEVLPASQAVHITNVETGNGLKWTSLEDALPWPIDPANASYRFIQDVAPITKQFNQELLAVHGLRPGTYTLKIDDNPIATFTAAQLEGGVNLATERTPMLYQGLSAGWTIRDKCDLQFVQERIAIGQLSSAALPALDEAGKKLEGRIHSQVQPSAHRFALSLDTSAY